MKKVIIIGASSGMGRRIAELYAERGWQVGVTARRQHLLEELRQQYPNLVQTSEFDVRCEDCRERIDELAQRLGGLDIFIISAGGGEISEELDWETDKKMTDINVNGFLKAANWAFNHFLKQGHGRLATISSIAAIRGNSGAPAYSASKAFQSTYFEGLAIRARRLNKNISVTCIEPGFVATPQGKAENLFWVLPVDTAARQIIRAIDLRKRKVHLSRRWAMIAWILKWMPYPVFRRLL